MDLKNAADRLVVRLGALAEVVARVTFKVRGPEKLGQAYVPDVEGVYSELVRNVSLQKFYHYFLRVALKLNGLSTLHP